MAEKNYIMQAVVPEAPRTIDEQQLHVYVPQGSTDNFGVFKPDGQQFVITSDGILRVDASKLIQLATPSAQVVEDGGETSAEVQFTETDHTLLRQFQFIFKNIKGDTGATGATGQQGPKGDDGLSYLAVRNAILVGTVPEVGTTLGIALQYFLRTPVVDDMVYIDVYTTTNSEQIHFLCYCRVASVSSSAANCYIRSVTRSTGTQGPQGPKGDTGETGQTGATGADGVSITSVTQTGVQGGTQVTITLSNGQSTSFIVYNGINTNFQIVDSLPTENISTSTIYLVPSTKPEAENVYDEYIYVNGNWEHIGSTSIDLSDYVTKTFFNQNVGDATKNYITTQLSGKADASALNTKLDKVATTTVTKQAYVKNADGTQRMVNIGGTADDDIATKKQVADAINAAKPYHFTYEWGTVLTAEQKAGIQNDPNCYFFVTMSDGVTYQYRRAAVEGNRYYFMAMHAYTQHESGEVIDVGQMFVEITTGGDRIISESILAESLKNKTDVLNEQSTDNQYPTAKATYDADQATLTAAKPYHFTYEWGTVLTAEQKAGIQNDPNCYFFVTMSDGVTYQYRRAAVEGNRYYFMAMHAYTQHESGEVIDVGQMFVEITTGGDRIISESILAESLKNKTDVLNEQSTDNQYPTAKATYDADQATLTAANNYTDTAIANAITTTLNTPV